MQEKDAAGEQQPEDKEVTIVDVANDVEKAKLPYTKSFNVTWKNPETGIIKTGTFTAQRPGLGKFGQIAVHRAKLNGGMTIDPVADFTHMVMANLHYVLVDFPDWWRPDEFFTANPLLAVWSHVEAWLTTFRSGGAG